LPLSQPDLNPDPIEQFRLWFDEARAVIADRPEAMTLATAEPGGRVSGRVVLLKGITDGGFVFFTNYESEKARQLEDNPQAALVFWWPPLDRQVRVEGRVTKVTAEESDDYFATRARGSQLGAWASDQSRTIEDRATLESRLGELESRFEPGSAVPRPPHWGGYRLTPDRIELWQGRPDRLHDRCLYEREGAGWRMKRLAP
jgi:pyridoxamine 5'-phosphate oxidase